MLSPTYPVTFVLASPPLLRPKPIRPKVGTTSRTKPCARGNQAQPQRPGPLRASTLDGRSLSEVIDAAHRASMSEQAKYCYSPESVMDSRRMSFDDHRATPYNGFDSMVSSRSRTGSIGNVNHIMEMR